MAKIWPFVAKIWPFFGQNWQFLMFLAFNFQTTLWIFLIFAMEVVPMVFSKGNHILYAGKILIWQIFGHGTAKFSPFKANFESFGPITSKCHYEASEFLVWKLFWWSSFRKSYSLCWENYGIAKFVPFKAIFWPKLKVLKVFDI